MSSQECGALGEEERVAAIKGGIIHATRGVDDGCDFVAQAACRLVVYVGDVFLVVRPICVAVGTVWSFTCAVVRGRKVDVAATTLTPEYDLFVSGLTVFFNHVGHGDHLSAGTSVQIR
ncbi:unnamed protein product [Ascophyllum nodosum]